MTTAAKPGEEVPDGFEKVVPGPGLTMLVARGLTDHAGLASRVLAPGGDAPAPHVGRAELRSLTLPDGGNALVRPYLHGGVLRRLTRDRFASRPPRPFVELAVTAAARDRGVATVEVLAALVARGAGPWYRGWLVTRELQGARNLWAALQGGPSGEAKQSMLRRAGRALRLMHLCGLDHGDLNLRNLLVLDRALGPEVYVIDFDKARLFPGPVPAPRARRNLRRLRRSVRKLDPDGVRLGRADWGCLLDAYGADR